MQKPTKELANYGDITVSISPITYTVTYDSKGGSSVNAGSYSISSKLSSLPTPTRVGYAFADWYYDEGLTQSVSLPMPETTQAYPTNTNQITFYAKWTTKSYTLKFQTNGGSTVSEQSYDVIINKITSHHTPTRLGYKYEGCY